MHDLGAPVSCLRHHTPLTRWLARETHFHLAGEYPILISSWQLLSPCQIKSQKSVDGVWLGSGYNQQQWDRFVFSVTLECPTHLYRSDFLFQCFLSHGFLVFLTVRARHNKCLLYLFSSLDERYFLTAFLELCRQNIFYRKRESTTE